MVNQINFLATKILSKIKTTCIEKQVIHFMPLREKMLSNAFSLRTIFIKSYIKNIVSDIFSAMNISSKYFIQSIFYK